MMMNNLNQPKQQTSCFCNLRHLRRIVLSAFVVSFTHQSILADSMDMPEPPVQSTTVTDINPTGAQFNFDTSASLHSDLRWRGITITQQNPGFESLSHLYYNHGRFATYASFNTRSYTMGPQAAQSNLQFTDAAYLMLESRLGTRIILGDVQTSSMSLTLSRGIFTWPGGYTWYYTDIDCAGSGTADTYLTQSVKIDSVKTTDIRFQWGDLSILYSLSDDSPNNAYYPTSALMWQDYLLVQTQPRSIFSKQYSFDLGYGYLKHTGRHFDFNMHYHFNPVMTGTIKAYNFKAYASNFANEYGIVGIMRYQFS